MTKQHKLNKLTYVRPMVEVVDIETQQMFLSGSNPGQTEGLGDKKEDLGWSSSRGGWDFSNYESGESYWGN